MSTSDLNPEAVSVEAPQMNFLQRLMGIYFEPTRTFEDINRKGAWIGMFLIICALGLATNYAFMSRVDYESLMRRQIQQNPLTRNMSEEQIQAAVAAQKSGVTRYVQIVAAPVVILITYLLLAAVFLLMFTMMGASLRYKKVLATTVWGMGPPGIIVSLLSILFIYLKDPETLSANPLNNVVSNLGLMVSDQTHPVIHSFLSSIDIFSFWTILLLAIGFAAISDRKLTVKKSVTGVVILWAVWVLGKAGWAMMFS